MFKQNEKEKKIFNFDFYLIFNTLNIIYWTLYHTYVTSQNIFFEI